MDTKDTKSCSKVAIDYKDFTCDGCNKYFKSRVGLWKHSKNCISEKDNKPHIDTHDKKDELIMMLLRLY